MSRRSILHVLLSFFGVSLVAAAACVIPWITTLGFLRTEQSSSIGYDGASFWQSGLPFRFLIRSDLGAGMTIDTLRYWSDVAFWFVVSLLLIIAVGCYLQRPAHHSMTNNS